MTEIYPRELSVDETLPSAEQFAVTSVNGRVGRGVRAKVPFERGTRLASFTGVLSNRILQHTLQVTPETHLHDPHFVGLLSHSCAPNCVLDMARLEVWALTDIASGDLLTIDYAMTEDTLFRQFPCNCGSPTCRKWITGRHEKVDATGKAYLDGLASNKVGGLVAQGGRGAP